MIDEVVPGSPWQVGDRVMAIVVPSGPHGGAYADEIVPRGDDFGQRIRTIAPVGVDALADGAVLDAAVLPAIRDGG